MSMLPKHLTPQQKGFLLFAGLAAAIGLFFFFWLKPIKKDGVPNAATVAKPLDKKADSLLRVNEHLADSIGILQNQKAQLQHLLKAADAKTYNYQTQLYELNKKYFDAMLAISRYTGDDIRRYLTAEGYYMPAQ